MTSEVQKHLFWVTLKGQLWKDTPKTCLFLFPHTTGYKQPTKAFYVRKEWFGIDYIVESSDSANIGKKQTVMKVTKTKHWHLQNFPPMSSTNKKNTEKKLGPCLVFSTACGMHRILRLTNMPCQAIWHQFSDNFPFLFQLEVKFRSLLTSKSFGITSNHWPTCCTLTIDHHRPLEVSPSTSNAS